MSYRSAHHHHHHRGLHFGHAHTHAKPASHYHVNVGMVTVVAGCAAFWAAIAALLIR